MPPSKSSFVTACQQFLALGVVIAALTPAASVVSLDVVRESPSGQYGQAPLQGDLAAYTRAAERPAKVPTAVVDPTVDEHQLTAPPGQPHARLEVERAPLARGKAGALGGQPTLTSLPEPVSGYGTVGVTWAHGTQLPEGDITLQVRTRTGDSWSGWLDLEYHDDHGPDPGSEEARHARPGTDELLVGDVDQVQVKVATTLNALPADLKLAVVDPGRAARSAMEKPALDTTSMDGTPGDAVPSTSTTIATDDGEGTGGSDRIDLSAATFTPKPQIFSRAQWGADERMRDKSSLHYFEVHAGFVHHTVNANDYTRDEVPAILRSIYAYHTQSRGWSDIGYNFLVDRFGRIWEGRYGGIDRPVVGAHTLNYNDYAFAMSAIGNYDIKQPSQAMVQAYGALFAWKLSLHGVDASSTKQWVGSRYFEAINGHRDAASTACPGRYLYAKIPQIRRLAAEAQRGWSGRELESNLAGSSHPDLVVRRASDGQGFVIPTGGLTAFGTGVPAASGLTSDQTVITTPDVTGDGVGDLVVVDGDGTAEVRPGNGKGAFGAAVSTIRQLAGHDLVTAAGDLNGDGRNDLVARWPDTGRLDALYGRGDGRFRVQRLGTVWGGYTALVGAGDVTGDGKADLLGRAKDGTVWLHPGTGKGFAKKSSIGSWDRWTAVTGLGDFDGDGDTDLFARDADTKNGFVLPSNGDGTFGHPLGPILRIASVGSLVGAAQLLGDGTPDLVARTGAGLTVFPNSGTTELRAPIATGMDLSNANLVMNAGDWDRDGFADVINRNTKTGALFLRRGDGKGHFAKPVKLADGFSGVGLLGAVGDMTGDGWPDLMGQPAGGAIRIYPGAGLDGLHPSYVAHGRIDAGRQVPVGRWDGDGAPDSLFRQGNRLTLFPGNGPGGLTGGKPLGLDLSPYDWVVGISDIQLTGHADLVVREKATGDLWLLQGTAAGFKTRRYLGGGMGVYDLAG
ncbi:FG-GAP-like repeat-containing protein [Nocardioides sp. URHA0032]|uniref:FG-GAP-like repeat-containing protein n=1 Tax=Nocardioides sp. URHA0032 TaxID=1380388 RepID=UPI0006842622|nr:FG-GAP-like repeat-containing protein [Nocardioides sp. URHA0032]